MNHNYVKTVSGFLTKISEIEKRKTKKKIHMLDPYSLFKERIQDPYNLLFYRTDPGSGSGSAENETDTMQCIFYLEFLEIDILNICDNALN